MPSDGMVVEKPEVALAPELKDSSQMGRQMTQKPTQKAKHDAMLAPSDDCFAAERKN
jgi:hypothetical protein